ncbi:uncharacterized protein EAF02_004036 [Botrytis sinoallii]|uniref:uncharacterized protein n=1 Tax=Botrytis sinoallii TaxID=1463999 RepID=UPI00190187A3|nr:uncharacterized protein EAF02_004036 [Botrytis sinoallii]KAF7885527.1 hypothetical protein EAF02_004036 [Botrytis sinoallii]
MCRHMTITYSCGCLTRSVEACPHSLSMKIAPEDCQFHFSEPIHREESDCLSCVVRTTQRIQKKLESMQLKDFHVANLKFPPSPSPPLSHPKSLGTRVLKKQEKAKELDRSYQVPVRRESGEEEEKRRDAPSKFQSTIQTPREIEADIQHRKANDKDLLRSHAQFQSRVKSSHSRQRSW